MWKLFNFRWDRRTAWNLCKMPFIIGLRTPVMLFFLAIEWINDFSEIAQDKLPGWDSE